MRVAGVWLARACARGACPHLVERVRLLHHLASQALLHQDGLAGLMAADVLVRVGSVLLLGQRPARALSAVPLCTRAGGSRVPHPAAGAGHTACVQGPGAGGSGRAQRLGRRTCAHLQRTTTCTFTFAAAAPAAVVSAAIVSAARLEHVAAAAAEQRCALGYRACLNKAAAWLRAAWVLCSKGRRSGVEELRAAARATFQRVHKPS